MKEQVLKAMREAGKPVSAGDVTKALGADLIKRVRIIFTPTPSTKKDMDECAKVITENKFARPH